MYKPWIIPLCLGFLAGLACSSVHVSAQSPALITGVGGIFFEANDPAALGSWYAQHLGIASQPAGRGPKAPRFHLFHWSDPTRADNKGNTVWSIFPSQSKYLGKYPFMVNYRVDHLDLFVEQLRRDGVKVEKVQQSDEGRFTWLTDPEDHRIELWEPPTSLQSK